MKNQKGVTLTELLIVLAIMVIIAIVALGGKRGAINLSHGDGTKIGQVVKLSKQGFIRQTWESQLIRGGMVGGSGAFGTQPFDFTIEDDDLVQKVEQYMEDQTEVIIKYRIEGLYWPLRSESSGCFLVSIEPAKK